MGRTLKNIKKKLKRYSLSPKGAEEIYRNEIIDPRGNKQILIIDLKPQRPSDPTIETFVNYGDD